jgi:hypothetical protein
MPASRTYLLVERASTLVWERAEESSLHTLLAAACAALVLELAPEDGAAEILSTRLSLQAGDERLETFDFGLLPQPFLCKKGLGRHKPLDNSLNVVQIPHCRSG